MQLPRRRRRLAPARNPPFRFPSGAISSKLCTLPQALVDARQAAKLKAAATAGLAASPCISRCTSFEIPALRAEEQLCSGDWPSLTGAAAPAAGLTLVGAWRHRFTAPITAAPADAGITSPAATPASQQYDCSADAEDVQARPAPAYLAPARRARAPTTILAGCRLVRSRPAAPAPAATHALCVPPQRHTPAQHAASQQAARPSKLCAWPLLTSGPCSGPCTAAAPRPAYLLALLGC